MWFFFLSSEQLLNELKTKWFSDKISTWLMHTGHSLSSPAAPPHFNSRNCVSKVPVSWQDACVRVYVPVGHHTSKGGVLINGIYDLANWYLQLGPELLRLWRWFNRFYENTKELMLLIMHVAFCAIGVRQRLSFREGKTGFPSSLRHTAQ